MDPTAILKIVLPKCPQGFHPVFLLETEVEATSLIKRAWILSEGEWKETSLENYHLQRSNLTGGAKVKFFTTGSDVHCFVNDKAVRYFDHFVIPLTG